MLPSHPAKYSDNLMDILDNALMGYRRILDPFAGVGKLAQVRPDAFLLELQYKWIKQGKPFPVLVGDAHSLPFETYTFDAICTSPTYGNRMADHFTDHQPQKGYKRNTYQHFYGEPLHPNNSGLLQWGEKYRDFHKIAWAECKRVLRPGGRFILNISDHIRAKKRIYVSEWHISALESLGFIFWDATEVETPRNGNGQNRELRVECEYILIFELPSLVI